LQSNHRKAQQEIVFHYPADTDLMPGIGVLVRGDRPILGSYSDRVTGPRL